MFPAMTDFIDVSDTTPRISYTATASQTVFAVPFVFFSDDNLFVYKNGVLLTLTTDYTVSGAENENGGTVTLLVGATVSDSIMIARSTELSWTSHIPPSGPLDIGAINIQFSRFVAMLQEQANVFLRALRQPANETTVSMELPADRAGRLLGFDANKNAISVNADYVDSAVAADAAAASAAAAAASVVAAGALITAASQQLGTSDSLVQNNVSDPNNSLDVLLNGVSVVTKRLDVTWVAGTNQGGFDSGIKGAGASLHGFLIRKNSDGTTLDAVFSASATAPTIPAGWTMERVIWSGTSDGSSHIRGFLQIGSFFQLNVPVVEYNGATGNVATTVVLTSIPHGVKMMARLFFNAQNVAGSGGYANCWDPDLGVSVTTTGVLYAVVAHGSGDTQAKGSQTDVTTDAAGQINISDNASTASTATIACKGHFDPRVRRRAI